jgi:TetR/AcrR family transcriptional regulator, repressor for uid operon
MRKANPLLAQQRREEVLAAAIACFTNRGFHQTSMQDIAAASGLSMGSLYRYFDNKEAIIEGAALQDRDETLSAIAALQTSTDLAKTWAKLLMQLAAAASEPDYARLVGEVLAEAGRVPKLRDALRANDAAIAAAIEAKLLAQIEGGLLPKVNAAGAAQALLILFEGLTYRKTIAPRAASAVDVSKLAGLVQAVFQTYEVGRSSK